MRIVYCILLLFSSIALFAQKQDYFVLEGKDTVRTEKISYYNTTISGKLKNLTFTNLDGTEVTIASPVVDKIITLYINGNTIDRVSNRGQNMRSNGTNYVKRETSGVITCWIVRQQAGSSYGHVYFKLLIDGQYYQVHSRKEYEKVLLPLFQNCPAIKQLYNAFNMPKKISILTINEEKQLLELIKAFNKGCEK